MMSCFIGHAKHDYGLHPIKSSPETEFRDLMFNDTVEPFTVAVVKKDATRRHLVNFR